MDKIDFVKLAKEIVLEFKEEYDKKEGCEFFGYQLYVSVLENGNIETSTRPEVLRKGNECIIIMTHRDLAITNYYLWYVIKHIDEKGNVHNGYSVEGWNIKISAYGSYSNQRISLSKDNEELYDEVQGDWNNPWDVPLHNLWSFYQIVRKCSSKAEIMYVSENYHLKEKINELNDKISGLEFVKKKLEMEKKQYKSLLKEIKELVENR